MSCCSKFASKHCAQLSFWATFYIKLKLAQNTVRNPTVAQNWPFVGLRNCRFAWNWPVLLRSPYLWKTLCKTFLLLEIAPNHTAKLSFCLEGKVWGKHRAQLSFCSKLAPSHNAQLSFCLKWATFLIKLKLVQNTVRNRAVSRNWPQVRLRNYRIVRKVKPVRNCMGNCPVNQNWCLLWKS